MIINFEEKRALLRINTEPSKPVDTSTETKTLPQETDSQKAKTIVTFSKLRSSTSVKPLKTDYDIEY